MESRYRSLMNFTHGTRSIRVPSGGVPLSSGCVLLMSACVKTRPPASADVIVHRFAFPFPRPSFTVPRSLLRVHRSPFRVHRSAFPVPRSVFTVPRSLFHVPCSPFTVPRSSFRVPSSPFRVHHFYCIRASVLICVIAGVKDEMCCEFQSD